VQRGPKNAAGLPHCCTLAAKLATEQFVIVQVACVTPFAAMASRFQGVHKESTGYKMLAALGWREGEGLVRRSLALILQPMSAGLPLTRVGARLQGAMKQGITEHIRVKKIHEKTGVGAVTLTFLPDSLSASSPGCFCTS